MSDHEFFRRVDEARAIMADMQKQDRSLMASVRESRKALEESRQLLAASRERPGRDQG